MFKITSMLLVCLLLSGQSVSALSIDRPFDEYEEKPGEDRIFGLAVKQVTERMQPSPADDWARGEELLEELAVAAKPLIDLVEEVDEETGGGFVHILTNNSLTATLALENANWKFEKQDDDYRRYIKHIGQALDEIKNFRENFLEPDDIEDWARKHIAAGNNELPNVWQMAEFIAAGHLKDKDLQRAIQTFYHKFDRIERDLRPILDRLAGETPPPVAPEVAPRGARAAGEAI